MSKVVFKLPSLISRLFQPEWYLLFAVLFSLSLLSISTPAQAQLQSVVSYQQTDYQLCAKQRVTKALFFDVVDVGVYYSDCDQAKDVFDEQPKLLRFSYLRKVEGIQFTKRANDFLSDNLTESEKQACLNEFKEFNTVYKNVADGDYYDLFVIPGQGLDLRLNQSELATFENPTCAVAYLNIWFGKESMDDDFRDLQEKLKSLN